MRIALVSIALWALPAAAYTPDGEPSPASAFDFPARHNDQCVHLAHPVVPLRYADFTPTGYVLDASRLRFAEPPTDDDDGHRCRDGEVQLDAQEIVQTPQGRLLFHRGGHGYVDSANVKYGHLWIADLADHAEVASQVGENGKECQASTNPSTHGDFRIVPRSLPAALQYRKSNYDDCVRSHPIADCLNGYQSYGDPGADQGDPAVLGAQVHYTYLVWSWIDVAGGGVVRTLLAPGQVFHRCNVRSIKLDAYDEHTGAVNGWVQAVYGKARIGDNWFYGWTVYAHQHFATEAQPVYHVEPLEMAPPRDAAPPPPPPPPPPVDAAPPPPPVVDAAPPVPDAAPDAVALGEPPAFQDPDAATPGEPPAYVPDAASGTPAAPGATRYDGGCAGTPAPLLLLALLRRRRRRK